MDSVMFHPSKHWNGNPLNDLTYSGLLKKFIFTYSENKLLAGANSLRMFWKMMPYLVLQRIFIN